MLDRVLQYMEKYNMIQPGDRIVVGVSGGADSLALLHILNEIKSTFYLELVVAHVHHGLRGKDADEDAQFVEKICKDWNLPFYLKKENVKRLANSWGISEEEAGRKVRYEFFERVLDEVKGHKIALAHHRDDQAETILYHLIRGTGLKGLQGIKPIREGRIIRPLLCISRKEIEEYCLDKNLAYRTDVTNQEIIYVRNRIRNVVIPYIQKYFNPNFSESLVRMADILREEEEFFSCYSEQIFNKWATTSNEEVSIPLNFFNSLPKAIRRRIIRLGVKKLTGNVIDISYVHVEQIINLASNSSVGSILDLPGKIKAKKDYKVLFLLYNKKIHSIPSFQYPISLSGRTYIKELDIEIFCQKMDKPDVWDKGSWCIYIDSDKIQGLLWVRNRRSGDKFQPLGMKGTKKLKDYFIDKKIPRDRRDTIPLVVDKHNIIWVVGHQLNENYKITQNTKNVLKLRVRSNSKIMC